MQANSPSADLYLLPAVLWVEPQTGLCSNRHLLNAISNYSVTTASTHSEVSDLSSTAIVLAILSDALGELVLGAVARYVRIQWPSARIVLLKRKQPVLEDYLYDEDMDYLLLPKEFGGTITRLLNQPDNQRLLN